MRIAPFAVAVLSFSVVAGPGCFLFGKKVKKDDCDRWSAQFEKVVKAEGDKKCKGNKDGEKSFKKALNQLKDGDNTACSTQASTGVMAIPKDDDDCFMKASTVEDWKKCNFAATSPLFVWGGAADGVKATWAGCSAGGDDDDDDKEEATSKKKKKGDDDDDDDKSSKKKKKKGDDDDDDNGGW